MSGNSKKRRVCGLVTLGAQKAESAREAKVPAIHDTTSLSPGVWSKTKRALAVACDSCPF